MSSNTSSNVSCVECHRRKQKCNREFPCNQCLKRGVAHLCRSNGVAQKASRDGRSGNSQNQTSKKRSRGSSDDKGAVSDGELDENDYSSSSEIDVSDALSGLGYMSHHHHLVLGQGPGPKEVRDVVEKLDDEQNFALGLALQSMPERKYTDCLVDNWLNGGNHQYYALYPPEFRDQYKAWWEAPRNKKTPEITSLILRVCACSLHFIIDNNVRIRLETELDVDVMTLANRLHTAAEKLSTSIPPGKGGLAHVQQLFLTTFWLKSAEQWTDAWHSLSKAIRAANEIGLHQDALSEGMSEFDREMRRRVWVILYLWDFALGSMLSRPLLVNHADCTIVMPTLTLENNPSCPDQPSPFRHMILHCQLCIDMVAQMGGPAETDGEKAEAAKKMRDAVDVWFAKLPAEYSVTAPDTRWDSKLDWVVFQRRYLHLIGFMGRFSQLRPFITRSSAKPMTPLETELRASGVDAALGLMKVSWSLFENLVTVGAKFHYAIFCIFDAATVMCSAFLQDEARNLPHRETTLEAIKKALSMIAEVAPESKTSVVLYRILKGLLTKLPLSTREQGVIGAAKRAKNSGPGSTKAASTRVAAAKDRNRRSRQGSTSASSDSDSTLDSLGMPACSESPVSVPDSDRVRRGSVVPSNGVPSVDSVSSTSSFIPPGPIPAVYPGAAPDYFLPVTTAVPTTVFMAPEGFPAPAPGFVQPVGFPYGQTLSPVDPLAMPHPEWQPAAPVVLDGINNAMGAYPPSSIAGLDNTAPEVLEYWEWESLGFGNPVSWPQAVPDPRAMQQHDVLPVVFSDPSVTNDGRLSPSTETLSR
ncbi:hypothetical protein C8A05DRAFT_43644 [Staphylotrichum tortipilum]|uniref:Zn(2)-C6 fungal-type domain-containing protein n=1 Tax=Staphylotrichum tortipilum TaxID=2831512 RepID=A0AAN6MMM8_9PEZI|nr:hypothetical protein C8A05DRAFT_43644 [Staphylotrichum longicolle]